ncbi:MAG: hypothetical protein Q7W02_08230 [Candidatus Rokubacteria bacterium]|nr:hypothetical protein [Candidatus Rokubacteria bacterium]
MKFKRRYASLGRYSNGPAAVELGRAAELGRTYWLEKAEAEMRTRD